MRIISTRPSSLFNLPYPVARGGDGTGDGFYRGEYVAGGRQRPDHRLIILMAACVLAPFVHSAVAVQPQNLYGRNGLPGDAADAPVAAEDQRGQQNLYPYQAYGNHRNALTQTRKR